jgi:hypothetical protein
VEPTDTHRKQKQINGVWVSVGSTVGLFLFSMSVCRFHRWFVFVFYECLSVPPLVCFCFLSVSVRWNWQTLIENKNKPTVEPTGTHRKQKQINGGTDRHRWFVFVFYQCLSVPPLVCFCFLSVSVSSTVGLFLFSMSVCQFHRWFVFVFYECLSVLIENKNKPTVELTDTHRKQKQSWFVFVFYECLSVPLLVCFCFLWVSVVSIVVLLLFSMSVCQFHRWLGFVFYECLSVLIENKNKPTVKPTDTHRKQKQTNGGTDRHS